MRSKDTLRALRDKNPNVMKMVDFARSCKIRKEDVLDAVMNDGLEIVDEFIYPDSSEYISLNSEKNRAFYDKKQFEIELRENLKREKIEASKKEKIDRLDVFLKNQSLRMKLVWHFCPKTKKIASDLAQKDGYLSSLLAKEDDEEKILSQKEEIKIRSYEREFWLRAGVEELKEAHKKADEILNLYFSKGLDAIDDPEIREIIELYYN